MILWNKSSTVPSISGAYRCRKWWVKLVAVHSHLTRGRYTTHGGWWSEHQRVKFLTPLTKSSLILFFTRTCRRSDRLKKNGHSLNQLADKYSIYFVVTPFKRAEFVVSVCAELIPYCIYVTKTPNALPWKIMV